MSEDTWDSGYDAGYFEAREEARQQHVDLCEAVIDVKLAWDAYDGSAGQESKFKALKKKLNELFLLVDGIPRA